MYFGLWWGKFYLQGNWFIGVTIVTSHYAITVFGYTFIGDFRYKTNFPRVFSYYSSFEESFGTFLFAPLFNVVLIAFPILVGLQLVSYMILLVKCGGKLSLKELKNRIQHMLKTNR